MKFDVIVGNPPYGVAQKGSTPTLHLKIMKNSLSFCTGRLTFIMPSKPITVQLKGEWYDMFKNAVCNRVEVMDKEVFKKTNMDKTAIFYCDRNDKPENYCKKLDVDNAIYNAIDSDAHRLFIDKMGRMNELKIFIPFIGYYETEEDFNRTIEKIDDGYYLNVSRIGSLGAKWISNTLKKVDILTKDEEIDFCNLNRKRKEILKCPTKEYGENLKNLMLNGLVLRYSLWLVQDNRAIYQAQFKYVPNIDYTNIHNDEELLSACGFTPEEIEKTMDYLRHFDFSQNRNDMIRDFRK